MVITFILYQMIGVVNIYNGRVRQETQLVNLKLKAATQLSFFSFCYSLASAVADSPQRNIVQIRTLPHPIDKYCVQP